MNRRLSSEDFIEESETICEPCVSSESVSSLEKRDQSGEHVVLENMDPNFASSTEHDTCSVKSLSTEDSERPISSNMEAEYTSELDSSSGNHSKGSLKKYEYLERDYSLANQQPQAAGYLFHDIKASPQDNLSVNHSQTRIKIESSPSICGHALSELPNVTKEERIASSPMLFSPALSELSYISKEENFYYDIERISKKKVHFSEDVIQFTISPAETILSSDDDSFREVVKSEPHGETEQMTKSEDHSVEFPEKNFLYGIVKPRRIVTARSGSHNFRPSRNRVQPLRPWLGERATYSTDSRGFQTLIKVSKPRITRKMYRRMLREESR